MRLSLRWGPWRSPRLVVVQDLAHIGEPLPEDRPGWQSVQFDLRDQAQAQAALVLAECLSLHPCAEIAAGPQRLHIPHALRVLRCYLQSCGPADWRAHCWQLRPAPDTPPARSRLGLTLTLGGAAPPPEPAPPPPRPWLFPCRLASAAQASRYHPATLRAQVEAALHQAECAWCPRLHNLDEWDLLQWGRLDDEEPA